MHNHDALPNGLFVTLDALPYMVLLLLVEFTVGGLLVVYASQLRGLVTRGFLKLGASTVAVTALFSAWLATAAASAHSVGGYPLDAGFFGPTRIALWVLLLLTLVYAACIWIERMISARVAGATAVLTAVVALSLAAGVFQRPVWGYPGLWLALLAGALSLGAVTMGMVLGHWYLVTPRLPERPMTEFALVIIAILAVQSVLMFANLLVPVRVAPSADAGGGALLQNPAVWLRIGVGLAFPLALAIMAWRSSVVRGMMSATGLLYIATGAVLAGEALARGLLFITAIPF